MPVIFPLILFMNKRLVLSSLAFLLCFLPLARVSAAENTGSPAADLKQLVAAITEKVKAGKATEAALAPELAQFEALLAKYSGQKTDDVAQILMMKAMLYVQVCKNTGKAIDLIYQIKNDFPQTSLAQSADETLAELEEMQRVEKVAAALKAGAPFPAFAVQDLAGKPLALADYKGKVVLVDFWATWCGPCVAELPNVLAAYQKYHDKGFEIIGISLDKDPAALTAFLKEKNVTWRQYFDGLGWQNKLARQYGVNSIPMTYLLDGEGRILASNLRGPELEAEIARRLGQ